MFVNRAPEQLDAGEILSPALPEEDLAGLGVQTPPILRNTPLFTVHDAFSSDKLLYALPVVDEAGLPVGLVNRFKFFEMLSSGDDGPPFEQRPVSAVMDSAPLVVDERMSIDQLSDILVNDGSNYILDGFIITRDGRYLGIGTGYSLMRALVERNQAALFHLANYDALTELPNRHLFDDRLNQALAHAKRNSRVLALLFLDVDHLKALNDSLGHGTGDRLLKRIAQRLRSVVRNQDTVARLSGDEFGILLTELSAPDHSELVARKLLQVLNEPYVLGEEQLNVTCTIGIAVYPQDGANPTSLLRAADDAASYAKQFRNTSLRYSAEMQRTQPDALLAFSAVRRAIENDHLEVHYQPQIRAGSRTLHGVEALVRWRDPERGLMPTRELIRLAEDAGLIGAVTDHVLRSSMRQVLEWERQGLPGMHLAVNVSGMEVRDGVLIPMLQRHLQETGFPPSRLELEITESTVMGSDRANRAVLAELKRMGLRLSVDDFGTGYSSLSRLQRLPVDALKIDQSFVQGIEREGDAGALAHAIIAMAHSLHLVVTAEGVETTGQLMFLEGHGCDLLQGYVVSAPLAPQEIFSVLQSVAVERAMR
jgi:diguanylate cyclase (GGDEF)-like protein